jgi:hypothetical protein
MASNASAVHRHPWNKGKIVGQKAPFKQWPTSSWNARRFLVRR